MFALDMPHYRRKNPGKFPNCAAILVIIGTLLAQPVFADPTTALEDYVNKPDPAFKFAPIAPPLQLPGFTAHTLKLDSQKWRSPEEVDRTLWQHYLTIFVPDNLVSNINFMFIVGGSNGRPPPDLSSADVQAFALFAIASGTVVSVIQQVPNQPLIFADDPIPDNKRREDEIVAYTFDRATRTGDYNWPAYLPMVKSVVRAMDAVQSYIPTVTNPSVNADQFVVTGFSKRGATAWLTAAVDDRVIAVAPGVFDALNWVPSLENHRASYGFFSNALEDYLEFDLLDRLRTPEGQDLLQVIDPYSYRDRVKIPKYIVNSSGDEFFPSTSSLFYFNDLPDDALLRYLPNTNHGGENGGLETALQGILGWYQGIILGATRPKIDWELEDGTLSVTSSSVPLQAVLWQATNPSARDFRFNDVGSIWTPTPLVPVDGEFTARVTPPETGWTGFYVELTFLEPPGLPQVYSTQLFVTPEETPFALNQPVNNPRSTFFWAQEFAAATGDTGRYSPTYDANTLQSFLPLRVFDQYISTLDDAHSALKLSGGINQWALRQCLAVRLNIEAEKIDWYSPVQTFSYKKKAFLWESWNQAHHAFLEDRPGLSALKCATLNYQ